MLRRRRMRIARTTVLSHKPCGPARSQPRIRPATERRKARKSRDTTNPTLRMAPFSYQCSRRRVHHDRNRTALRPHRCRLLQRLCHAGDHQQLHAAAVRHVLGHARHRHGTAVHADLGELRHAARGGCAGRQVCGPHRLQALHHRRACGRGGRPADARPAAHARGRPISGAAGRLRSPYSWG